MPRRILTLNIRHGAGDRVHGILEFIAGHSPDIVVLTEFREGVCGDSVRSVIADHGWPHTASSSPPPRANGVLVASRLPFQPIQQIPRPKSGSKHRRIECSFPGFGLIGYYFPYIQRKVQYWPWFHKDIIARAKQPFLLVGDFSTEKKCAHGAKAPFFGSDQMHLLEETGWTDSWRFLHPKTREYTWFGSAGNGFRLDYAWLSAPIKDRLVKSFHDHSPRVNGLTDRSALIVDVDLP